MSKKYFDKLMVGSGSTNRAVESKFGSKMLAKMGWKEGEGLGKNQDGMKDCIQITRREEGTGLGNENTTPAATFKWNDSFWTDMYNSNASKFATIKGEGTSKAKDSSSSSSSSSGDSSDSEPV